MTSKSSSALAFAALLANLVVVATGCSSNTAAGDTAADPDLAMPGRDGTAEAPKAPPVGGTPSANELTDELGVFVSISGAPNAEGTHSRPLASIQAGIDLAKRVGKRVYVCSGTFKEALTLADSISVIGALDCTGGEWRIGSSHTRIESPSSPAVRANDITSATRLEGFEITSPSATQPSASSLGLFATHSNGLVVASTTITSGNGMKGDDGAGAIQLVNSATANGAPASTAAHCDYPSTCKFALGSGWFRPIGAAAGTNACVGAPGHAAQPGGIGGSGGLWEPVNDVGAFHFHFYKADPANSSDLGETNRTSAAGAPGTDGANAPALGSITADGYAPATGKPGSEGAPGLGGAGGAGRTPEPDYDPNTAAVTGVWRGFGGAGGGAGGCPGLAGTPATGGGASIAALLVDSRVVFDGAQLRSLTGGSAGRGSFGSAPTAGGSGGSNVFYIPMTGQQGGAGGAAGISGNGSNGPSVGIAHVGVAPDVRPNTTVSPGAGGTAIDARSLNGKTIPATPAGLSKDILGL